ncbi:MAG TPA: helix-turn-helix transcriptional regulator [Thermoanaerobaculia bacterium]|nr:helix-turn-helix transcriptional regulator [Thermoanaerobaculia bacterium]
MDQEKRTPGSSRVGHFFRSARKSRGLRIVEVARLAGLGDKARVLRRIDRLEREGLAPVDLVRTLCQFFGIEIQDVREAWKLDEEDRIEAGWQSCGGRPFFIVRFMASVYGHIPVPEGLDRDGLIGWSRSLLGEKWGGRLKGCLNFRDEVVWFEPSGTFKVTCDTASPSTSVRGKRFILREN